MQMSSNEAIKQAVMAGMGISILSLHTLGLELDHHLIACPETEGLPIMRRWHVVNNSAKTCRPRQKRSATSFWSTAKLFSPSSLRRAMRFERRLGCERHFGFAMGAAQFVLMRSVRSVRSVRLRPLEQVHPVDRTHIQVQAGAAAFCGQRHARARGAEGPKTP